MKPIRRPWMLAFVTAGLLAAPPPAVAQNAQNWLHVQVAGDGDDAKNFAMNVPVDAVGAVMSMIPTGMLTNDGQLTVAERHGLSVAALRQMWLDIRDAGDTEFVTLQHGDETVHIARAGDLIELRVEDESDTVRIDMPVVVVDALLSGEGETLNVSAALDELSALSGDVVRVTGTEQQIRVWIDDRRTQ